MVGDCECLGGGGGNVVAEPGGGGGCVFVEGDDSEFGGGGVLTAGLGDQLPTGAGGEGDDLLDELPDRCPAGH